MTRSILFGNSSSSQPQSRNLAEFRAGKMTMNSAKTVSADKRKGLVYVHQTDDSLMHFCWKDRTSGQVEDDLIIFPEDVVFKRVPECTTGRVYVLKFKSSTRRCFYWMQEPKTDKDTEHCSKVNQYLNNPPAAGSSRGAGSSPGGSAVAALGNLASELGANVDGDIQSLLNNLSQQQLMQLLGGFGNIGQMPGLSSLLASRRPSSGQSASSSSESATFSPNEVSPPAAGQRSSDPGPTSEQQSEQPAPAPASVSIQLSDLQNILSGINVPAEASGPAIDLNSAFNASALLPIFANKELMERVKGLLPQTTEDMDFSELSGMCQDEKQLETTLKSPQFKQALSMFSVALQSGQLGPLMQQFGMSKEVVDAANGGDINAFVNALQNTSAKKDDKGNDDEEDMALD